MNLSVMSREAFSELLASCLPSVRKFVLTRLRGGDLAEDVLQQTLLQALQAQGPTAGAFAKFKSWLCSIAVNEICMFHRRDRPNLPLEESLAMHRDKAPSPLEQLEQSERISRVRTAMAMLSERDRTALRLRDLEGRTLAETAESRDCGWRCRTKGADLTRACSAPG